MATLATNPAAAPLRAHSISDQEMAAVVRGGPGPINTQVSNPVSNHGPEALRTANEISAVIKEAPDNRLVDNVAAIAARTRTIPSENVILAGITHEGQLIMAEKVGAGHGWEDVRESREFRGGSTTFDMRAALNANQLPAKFTHPVPAASLEHIQPVAAREAAEPPMPTAAPTVHRDVRQMSNKQIVSEIYNLHDAFQELSNRYERAETSAGRSALRDQMRPIVNREGELREGYMSRVTQEIQRDATPPRVGESRRVMEPRIAVAEIAAGR